MHYVEIMHLIFSNAEKYIYIFQARYLHNDIFRYCEIYHDDITKCYLKAVLSKLITRVVIATRPGVQVFLVFIATFTLVEPTQPG